MYSTARGTLAFGPADDTRDVIVRFVVVNLSRWRDDPARKHEAAENRLTSP